MKIRQTKTWRTPVLTMIAILVVMALSGCKAPMYTDYSAFVREPKPLVTSTEYRMAPPDVVLISSKRVRELAGHQQQIRQDGMLTLPLVGNIFVAGRTPEEVSAELEKLAREYYQDADVQLRVVGYNSKKIFVFGEVNRPGPIAYNGSNTILGTMANVQPTRLADPERIQILRPDSNGKLVRRMTIDLDEMVQQGNTTLDAVLEEGDIIYVPPNPFAKTGLAFQQLLLPIRPFAEIVRAPVSIDESLTSAPYTSGDKDTGN